MRWALTSVCRARAPCPFAIATLAFTASRIAVTDIFRRRGVVDESACAGELRLRPDEVAALECEERPLGARHDAGPDRSSGDGRLGRLIQDRLTSVGVPREQHRHPVQKERGGRHGLVGDRLDTASSASNCIRSTPPRQSRARTVATQASRGLPSGMGSSDVRRSPRRAPNARLHRAGRARRASRPRTPRSRDTARAAQDRRTSRASAPTVVTRPLR